MIDKRPLSMDEPRRSLVIDDIPVPSPKKDFNALLEERLKDVDLNPQSQNAIKKFPFLKKGQGLARFRGNPGINRTATRSRCRSLPALSSNVKTSPVQKSVQKQKNPPKPPLQTNSLKKPPRPTKNAACETVNNNVIAKTKNAVPEKTPQPIPQIGIPLGFQKTKEQLNSSDLNSSDPEIKTMKELEEVRMFELMEEKMENSSICSNSSTVIRFMQQSSPFRNQLVMQRLSSQKISAINERGRGKQGIRESRSNILDYVSQSPLKRAYQQLQSINNEDSVKWEDERKGEKEAEENEGEKLVGIVPFGTDMMGDGYLKEMDGGNEDADESNASLHVRFAEYNEIKTIGLSDVSSISTSSRMEDNYSDGKVWSDYSADSSDTEDKLSSSVVRKNLVKQFLKQREDEVENDMDSYDDESTSTKVTEEEEEEEEEDEESSSKCSYDETLMETTVDDNKYEADMEKLLENQQMCFKSELLKARLNELIREIKLFRSHTDALKVQSQKLEEERKEVQRVLKENEEMMRAERERMDHYLTEEKKRLSREKAALDSRLKDAREKAQKNKQERDEIMHLRQQLDELREELYQKESKWQAAQARHKSQVRVLTTQNKELKEQIERLEKLKLERQNNRKPNNLAKCNTRAIHRINQLLKTSGRPSAKSCSSGDEDVENCQPSPESHFEQQVTNQQLQPKVPQVNIERQRHLYKNLLKDASIGIVEYEKAKRNAEEQCKHAMEESMQESSKKSQDNVKDKEGDECYSLKLAENAEISGNIQKSMLKNVKTVKEVDGHIEHWYSNGNVMKIFPDKNLKKLIYYNGDVRETDGTGKVKYYYASSRTWHTTMPDGLEILEYHDGKVETRRKSGLTEITYPDGTVRSLEANGLEKWKLPDGTIGETSADGNIVFQLTNGQREIHTKNYKKREYPDGTVKIVYADGINETRYKDGRIRRRDKDGNLVMDSYQQAH